MEFQITITKEQLLAKWSEQCSTKEWIEMYQKHSSSWNDWDTDLKLAEFIVKKVKKGYIDKYRDEDIPEVLMPILVNAITNNITQRNLENENITLKEVSGESELEAIRVLRDYDLIDYEDAIILFCDGYDFAERGQTTDLSKFSTDDLLQEIKKRI